MRPDSTFPTMVSLSISIVFCISQIVFCLISLFSKIIPKSFAIGHIPPPMAPIIKGTTMTLYPAGLSLVSKASCQYFVNFLSCLVAIFCCCGQAISQIQIFFFSLSSSIKSGLLAIVVFLRLNSKSQTSFPRSFSSTAPHSHRSLYQITSLPISSYSLAQFTAIIISALLCHVKYSLFARTIHPATICSTVSSLS